MIVSESFSLHFKSSNEMISSWGFKPFLSAVELMYGDCGSAYFYVSRKDFTNKQFDNLTFQIQGY